MCPESGRHLVIASNAGAVSHPDWHRNLLAHPKVTVEVNGETYDAMAIVTSGEERALLFAWIAHLYPFFKDHQARIAREIPVVALVRDEAASAR